MARCSWAPVSLSFLVVIFAAGCGGGGQNVAFMPTTTPTPAPSPTPTPTPAPSTVAITILPPTPVAVAEQIGTGGWASVSLPANGTLVVTLPAGTTQYGVALMCTATRE